jgi:hypothetical protein
MYWIHILSYSYQQCNIRSLPCQIPQLLVRM